MTFFLGMLFGSVLTLVVYHYRGWILSKLGINFPPKPPSV